MNNITWTIRSKEGGTQRNYWGNNLESCWRKMHLLKSNGCGYFILKILYHGSALPPEHVLSGPLGNQRVAAFFSSSCSDKQHLWSSRQVDGRRSCTSSDWNIADIDQFIEEYTK